MHGSCLSMTFYGTRVMTHLLSLAKQSTYTRTATSGKINYLANKTHYGYLDTETSTSVSVQLRDISKRIIN